MKNIYKYCLSFGWDIVIYVINLVINLMAVFLNVKASHFLKNKINEIDDKISTKIEML